MKEKNNNRPICYKEYRQYNRYPGKHIESPDMAEIWKDNFVTSFCIMLCTQDEENKNYETPVLILRISKQNCHFD